MSAYGKVRPLDFVQHHHIIGLMHAQLFVKAQGIFVEAGIHDDIILAAGGFVKLFDKGSTDTHAGALPNNTQIGDKEPIGEIRDAEADADDPALCIPCHQGDGCASDQSGDPLFKPFPGVLGALVRVLQKFNVFPGGEPFFRNGVFHRAFLSIKRKRVAFVSAKRKFSVWPTVQVDCTLLFRRSLSLF